MNPHKISIGVLVVTYNQYELTKKFIINFSNLFSEDNRIKLLILDNNSKDGTYINIKKEFPHVDIRLLNNNYGCVTGRNIGIVELINLQVDYICILDNDIQIEDREFFNKILLYMTENKEIDACCPIVKFGKTREIQTMGYRLNGPFIINIKKIEELKTPKIDILPGCAQFIRSSTFVKYGLYDNDLSPISIEDFEWGIRTKSMGINLSCCISTEVLHHHNPEIKDSKTKKEFVIVGRVIFLRKHFRIIFFLREIKYFVFTVAEYGLIFTVSAYFKGLKKKISFDNYKYENFVKIPFNYFYAN